MSEFLFVFVFFLILDDFIGAKPYLQIIIPAVGHILIVSSRSKPDFTPLILISSGASLYSTRIGARLRCSRQSLAACVASRVCCCTLGDPQWRVPNASPTPKLSILPGIRYLVKHLAPLVDESARYIFALLGKEKALCI